MLLVATSLVGSQETLTFVSLAAFEGSATGAFLAFFAAGFVAVLSSTAAVLAAALLAGSMAVGLSACFFSSSFLVADLLLSLLTTFLVASFLASAESLVAVFSSPSAFVVSAFPSVALSADGVFVSFSCFNGYVYS